MPHPCAGARIYMEGVIWNAIAMSSVPQDRVAEARDFYREQLARCFICTGAFARVTGRTADDVAGTEPFAAVLRECAFGSLDAARRIGEMAVVHLDAPAGG